MNYNDAVLEAARITRRRRLRKRRRVAGLGGAFSVTLTGLTGGEARQGSVIGVAIDPAITAETVTYQWQADGVDIVGATTATETVAIGTDHTDGQSLRCVVTIDGEPYTSSAAPMRFAPATGGADLDLSFPEGAAISSTNLIANWTDNGNTLTFVSVSPALPAGLSIDSSGTLTGTPTAITADATYTLTMQDEYGRQTSDTFTLEITEVAAPDVTAPTASGVTAGTQGANGEIGLVILGLSENSTLYWVLVPTGSTAPIDTEIVAGQASGGGAPSDSGSQAVTTTGGPYSLALTTGLGSTNYDLYIVFRDAAGNNSEVYPSQNIDIDTTAPTVTLTPPNDATDVSLDANIIMAFSEAMKQQGAVTLKNVGGADIETFDLSLDGTWNSGSTLWTGTPAVNFSAGADIAVRRSGLEDLRGNPIPAIADDTSWHFTTSAAIPSVDFALIGTGGSTQTVSAENGVEYLVIVSNRSSYVSGVNLNSVAMNLAAGSQYGYDARYYAVYTITANTTGSVTLQAQGTLSRTAMSIYRITGLAVDRFVTYGSGATASTVVDLSSNVANGEYVTAMGFTSGAGTGWTANGLSIDGAISHTTQTVFASAENVATASPRSMSLTHPVGYKTHSGVAVILARA